MGQTEKHYCDQTTCGSVGEGYCVFQESQNGGETTYCLPISELCPKTMVNKNIPQSLILSAIKQDDSLRKFREAYLNNTLRGQDYN